MSSVVFYGHSCSCVNVLLLLLFLLICYAKAAHETYTDILKELEVKYAQNLEDNIWQDYTL